MSEAPVASKAEYTHLIDMTKQRHCIQRASGSLLAILTTVPALLVVPAFAGVATAPPGTLPVLPASASRIRGGVRYDPSAPLDATIKPRFDTKNPPAVLSYDVTFKGGDDVAVPAIFVTPASAKQAPCVVLLHGLGGNKEQMYPLGSLLAQRGYASLMIDVAGHGVRPRIGGKAATNLEPSQMHKLAAQTIADLGRSVDWLDKRDEVDPKRIGFLGISLGGILGGVFISDDPRIHTAVLWAAGGDWGKLITTSSLTASNAELRTADAAGPIESVMSDVDPLTAIHAFAPRPLLFINGDKDAVVPVSCTKELTDAAGEPKKLIVLPGGHIPDLATMLGDSFTWFDAHLK